MFNNFAGQLTKYAAATTKDMQPVYKLDIKHVDPSTVQVFMASLDTEMGLDYRRYMQDPVYWNNIAFKELSYDVEVEIEDMVFDARIREITISRRVDKKTGDDAYTYVVKLEKDPGDDNVDTIIPSAFLNKKEEDENGKKKLVPLNIVFNKK